jgi:hypothetical protein
VIFLSLQANDEIMHLNKTHFLRSVICSHSVVGNAVEKVSLNKAEPIYMKAILE